MAIEIVDFPIKNGDFPWQNVSSPEGIKGPELLAALFHLFPQKQKKGHCSACAKVPLGAGTYFAEWDVYTLW